jgi:hypothetical protein
MAKKSVLTAPSGMAAPPQIQALIENFAEHRDTYHQGDYKEASLRNDFLNRRTA